MPTLRLIDGQPLVVGGELATSATCCCPVCSATRCPTGDECPEPCQCVVGRCERECSTSPCPGTGVCDGGICKPPCSVDGDCPDGQICVGGVCADPCDADEDCPTGRVCVGGVCEIPCDSTEDCPTGQVCVGGICETPCDTNEDCPDGQVCVDGVCETPCTVDGDCPDGQVCVDGVCRDPCGGGDPCPNGQVCVDGVCVPIPTGACCVDGACSITTEAECEGIWQGADTTCDDGDCAEDTCCIPMAYCAGYRSQCHVGYFAAACAAAGGTAGCDGTEPIPPNSGNVRCEGGIPASVTITVAGATAPDPTFQAVADEANGTFVVDLDCTGVGEVLETDVAVTLPPPFGTATFRVRVSVNVNIASSGGVTVSELSAPQIFSRISGVSSNFPSTSYGCAGEIMDCSGYATITTSSVNNSVVDFSNATLTFA